MTTTKQIVVTAPATAPTPPPAPTNPIPQPGNVKPITKIAASSQSGTAPVTVNVNAAGPSDPDGSIVSYN